MLEDVRKTLEFYANLDINKVLFSVYKDNLVRLEILDLNRLDQLFDKGIDSDGVVIGLYTPRTELLSGGKKKAGTHFTFFDTGKFFSTFKLIPLKTSFRIQADGQKDEDNLFDKYGKNIVGLTQENIDFLPEILTPKILQWVNSNAP